MKTLSIQKPPSGNEVGFRCHGDARNDSDPVDPAVTRRTLFLRRLRSLRPIYLFTVFAYGRERKRAALEPPGCAAIKPPECAW
jgi:hypothetical protein